MKSVFLTTALTGLLMATSAFAKVDLVASVEITIALDEVTNKAAALRYSTIADDLKNAIVVRLLDRIGEPGVDIHVDISEVELSNSFTEAVGSADTRLVGIVSVTDAVDNSNFDNYTLAVDVNQANAFYPIGLDRAQVTAGSNEYYKAMIDAFATTVVAALDK